LRQTEGNASRSIFLGQDQVFSRRECGNAHKEKIHKYIVGGSEPMDGEGKIVEADETYFGKPGVAHVSPRPVADGRPYIKGNKTRNSRAIVSLVERGGNVRSFHVAVADKETVNAIVNANIARESQIHTDESQLYNDIADTFFAYETVKHTRENMSATGMKLPTRCARTASRLSKQPSSRPIRLKATSQFSNAA
jgi:hypothetical protein